MNFTKLSTILLVSFLSLVVSTSIYADERDVVYLGDCNGDGVVDLRDVQPFIDIINSSTYQPEADCNSDFVVNLLDVDLFTDLLLAEIVPIIRGDVNQDGEVNLLDVAPFIDLISNGGYMAEADLNEDATVDLLDVNPFVEMLSGHNGQQHQD